MSVPGQWGVLDALDQYIFQVNVIRKRREMDTATPGAGGDLFPHITRQTTLKALDELLAVWDEFTEGKRPTLSGSKLDLAPLWKVLGAKSSHCQSCGAQVYWVTSVNNKPTPMNPWGTTHFQTCPKAKEHRKGPSR